MRRRLMKRAYKAGRTARIGIVCSVILAAFLMVSFAAASPQGDVTLSVSFRGLRLNALMQWQTVPLGGSFEVVAGDTVLGVVAANVTPEQAAQGLAETLIVKRQDAAAGLLLRPVARSIPEAYVCQDAVPVTLGTESAQRVDVIAYAREGLFRLNNMKADDGQPAGGAAFAVLDAAGQTVLSFSADEQGLYSLASPLPAGAYTLRQVLSPEGTIPAGDTAFEITPYLGTEESIAAVTVVNEPAPELDRLFAKLDAQATAAGNLYAADQTAEFAVAGNVPEDNTLPLHNVTVSIDNLALTDEEGGVLPDQTGKEIGSIIVTPGTPGILATVKVFDGQGNQAGGEKLLKPGQALDLKGLGAVSAQIVYVAADGQAIVPAGFVPGEIRFQVNMARRTPDAAKASVAFARAAVGTKWAYQYEGRDRSVVSAGGQSDALSLSARVLDNRASLAVSAQVLDADHVLLVIRHEGGPTLASPRLAVQLPDGWRVTDGGSYAAPVTAVSHGADADMVVLSLESTLVKDTVISVELPASIGAGVGTGAYYIESTACIEPTLDNPKGLMVRGIRQENCPVADAALGLNTPGVYAYGTWTAATKAQGDLSLQALGFALNGAEAALPEKGEAALLMASPDGETWHAVILPEGIRLLGVTRGQAYVTTDTAPQHDSVWIDAAAYTGDFRQVTAVSLKGGQAARLQVSADVRGGSVAFATLSRTQNGAAYTDAQGSITVKAGKSAALHGRVFDDVNGNGRQEENEYGAAGQLVFWQVAGISFHTYTDSQGLFDFSGAASSGGQGTLYVRLPDNTAVSGKAAQDGLVSFPQTDLNKKGEILVAFAKMGAVHGKAIWHESKEGLPGVEITLSSGGKAVASAVTDWKGQYRFEALAAGEYQVSVKLPDNVSGEGGFYPGDGYDSADGPAAALPPVTLPYGGEAVLDVPVRKIGSLHVTLVGYTYPLGKAALQMNGNAVAEADPAADGGYLFEKLFEGTYTFSVVLPEGLAVRAAAAQPWQKDALSLETTVTAGERTQLELEETVTGRLVAVFEGNGLSGAAVTISGPETLSAVLDGNGRCLFSNLIPGTYQVTATLPKSVLADTSGVWSIHVGPDGAAASLAVEVKPGEDAIPQAATLVQTAEVTGVLYEDTVHDGVLGTGEPAIAGALVDLYAMQDNAWIKVESARTGADGAYRFAGLTPGQYYVSIALPAGKALGDLKTAEPFQLESGQVLIWDAGVIAPASLLVNAFWDSSNDGIQGIYERAIEGTLAEVIPADSQTNAVAAQAYTNNTGTASFDSLPPGEYVIRFTLPEGYWLSMQGTETGSKYNAVPMADSRQGTTAPFTLAQGKEQGVGVGGIKTGLVSGRAWLDQNKDGIMGENEPGLAGCGITLSSAKSGLTYSYTTDDTGLYEIVARTDTYQMTVTGPEGMTFTRSSAAGGVKRSIFTAEGVTAGEKRYLFESGTKEENQNIGFVLGVNLSGVAFLDADYNGVWDAGEQPLPGVTVELSTAANKTLGSVTTDDDGTFRFDSLRGGEYELRAVLPDTGIVFSKAAEGIEYANLFVQNKGKRENTAILFLESGMDRTVGVGAVVPGSVSGGVFEDENYNGLYDTGEKPVSGVVVRLLDPDGNTVASMETKADGNFSFASLMPMAYTLGVEKPLGWMFTRQAEGLNRSCIVSARGNEGLSEPIPVALGQQVAAMHAGIVPPASVSGQVFGDKNDDGLPNNGESGFEGVSVTLLNEAGEKVAGLVTGADGSYAFNDLHPGRYALRYDLPQDTVFAKVASGGNSITGEGLAAAGEAFDLAIGREKQAPLCGVVALARISGVAFHDMNANGMYEDEEGRLEGLTLTLTQKSTGQAIFQIVTGEDGAFLMDRLRPGSYALSAGLPAGMIFTRENEEALLPASLQAQGSIDIEIAMGQRLDNRLIGGTVPASIAGRVWLDENNNGLLEQGEALLRGLTVMLVDSQTANPYARLTTDESGAFLLPAVHPGSYDITVVLPDNSIAANREAGENQFADSAAGKMTLTGLDVAEGEAVADIRAGVRQYTSIAGSVWLDEQGHLAPVGAVSVSLYGSSDWSTPLMTYVTAEDGAYRFDKLMPGEYKIAALLPDGFLFVKPRDERLVLGQAVSVVSNPDDGASDTFSLYMGKDQTAQDIGAVKTGSLGDIAWLDENKNGLQDAGEPGIPGLTVTLLQDGIAVGETVTDAYGYYLFENVYPMASQVRVAMYPELLPAVQTADFPLLSSVLAGFEGQTAYSNDLQVYSGGKNFNCDLGFILRDGAKRPGAIQPPPAQKWD